MENFLITPPGHGYVSNLPASKWEESMITGNRSFGALVLGNPTNERIILSHEKLFMPENPPTPAPNLGGSLETSDCTAKRRKKQFFSAALQG